VILTEAPLNSKANREKMCQTMLETFGVQGFYVAVQATLSLFSAGKYTGIAVDSGEGITHAVPIYDGYSLPHSISKMKLAGRQITDFLIQILEAKGEHIFRYADREIVQDMKEKI
jgi:actin-related protein